MKIRGSITVFLALALTCIFSGFFAFLEAARVSGLQANARMCTLQAKDALLASYNRALWEDYHLMFWEGQEEDFPQLLRAGSLQRDIVEGNWEQYGTGSQNFYVFPVHLTQVRVQGYQLATDNAGAAFRKQAAALMKYEVAEDTLKTIAEVITGAGDEQDEADAAMREQEALEALENLQKSVDSGQTDSGGGSEAPSGKASSDEAPSDPAPVNGTQTVPENPIEWMKDVKQKGILAFLMPEEEISAKKLDLSDSVGKRTLKEGTISETEKSGASDKMLFRLYLAKYFSSVTDEPGNHALDYEMEYLIAGKDSDKANLKAVVNRLLLLREAANLTYLETNPSKQQEALAVAVVLTTAVGQPELAEPVKHAVLAAWAYAESLSDVRILLSGGKVSVVKTDEQWHTQLNHLTSSVMDSGGEQQKKGLSYEGYLQVLLWSVSDRRLSQRAMTLIEKDTGVHMDDMVCRMNCTYEYEAAALFWNFVGIGNTSFSKYCFSDEAALDYFYDE